MCTVTFWNDLQSYCQKLCLQKGFLKPVFDSLVNWHLSDICRLQRSHCHVACTASNCTEKTIFPFPFKFNGIWSWWQFFFRFWTKWKSMENCHHDHIPLNLKGNGNIVFSVWATSKKNPSNTFLSEDSRHFGMTNVEPSIIISVTLREIFS